MVNPSTKLYWIMMSFVAQMMIIMMLWRSLSTRASSWLEAIFISEQHVGATFTRSTLLGGDMKFAYRVSCVVCCVSCTRWIRNLFLWADVSDHSQLIAYSLVLLLQLPSVSRLHSQVPLQTEHSALFNLNLIHLQDRTQYNHSHTDTHSVYTLSIHWTRCSHLLRLCLYLARTQYAVYSISMLLSL